MTKVQKTSASDASLIYKSQKGKDFIKVKLQHGTTWYEGEELKGEVDFYSTSNQTPVIIVDFHRTIKFLDSAVSNQVKFLKTEQRQIQLTNGSNQFSINIPYGCGGNSSIIIESDETILIEFVYEMKIFMKKNSLINFFGSIPIDNFATKINLMVYPLPLLKELKNQTSFEVKDDSEEWSTHNFSVTFPKKVFFLSEVVDLLIQFKKQKNGNSLKSLYVYLYQKISLKINTIEDSREEVLDGILEPILIGSSLIHEMDDEKLNVKIQIPTTILTDQSYRNSDFFVENFIEISASLLDFDSRGPSIDQDIQISSPIISEKRLKTILDNV
eukprot:gene3595-6330_t